MLGELFRDDQIVEKVQARLPELFRVAELECSRAGKVGMEVGSMREKILTALLIYKYGKSNVETELSIHLSEIDVVVHNQPVSIKTITGRKIGGVKLIWTVDREQAIRFGNVYVPVCDMMLTHINWGGTGGLYLFSKDLQLQVLQKLGRGEYITLPKPGTNPRGVEISTKAVRYLAGDPGKLVIPIQWDKKQMQYNPYKRWIDIWEQD